jgi:hypothetical protein
MYSVKVAMPGPTVGKLCVGLQLERSTLTIIVNHYIAHCKLG